MEIVKYVLFAFVLGFMLGGTIVILEREPNLDGQHVLSAVEAINSDVKTMGINPKTVKVIKVSRGEAHKGWETVDFQYTYVVNGEEQLRGGMVTKKLDK